MVTQEVVERAFLISPGEGGAPDEALGPTVLALAERPETVLRANWFMQNRDTDRLEEIRLVGTLSLPAGDASGSFVDTRDLAEAAARLRVDGAPTGTFTLVVPSDDELGAEDGLVEADGGACSAKAAIGEGRSDHEAGSLKAGIRRVSSTIR